MFYKIITQIPKTFSSRKNKSVSLKSLNLYSKDYEKKIEDKNNNYNTSKKKKILT